MIPIRFVQIAVYKIPGEEGRLFGLDMDGFVWAKILGKDEKSWRKIESPEKLEDYPDVDN